MLDGLSSNEIRIYKLTPAMWAISLINHRKVAGIEEDSIPSTQPPRVLIWTNYTLDSNKIFKS